MDCNSAATHQPVSGALGSLLIFWFTAQLTAGVLAPLAALLIGLLLFLCAIPMYFLGKRHVSWYSLCAIMTAVAAGHWAGIVIASNPAVPAEQLLLALLPGGVVLLLAGLPLLRPAPRRLWPVVVGLVLTMLLAAGILFGWSQSHNRALGFCYLCLIHCLIHLLVYGWLVKSPKVLPHRALAAGGFAAAIVIGMVALLVLSEGDGLEGLVEGVLDGGGLEGMAEGPLNGIANGRLRRFVGFLLNVLLTVGIIALVLALLALLVGSAYLILLAV